MICQKPATKVSEAATERTSRQAAVICLALAALAFVVFGQTLGHDFINYDDDNYVYNNPVVAQGLTIKGIIWAFSFHASNWHPLTWLSHMVDCELYGLNPLGHHFTNVLLHAATAIALFLTLRQMTGALWRSAFVAAIFAIHPLRVESVAWVAERKDVLSGLFFMLTIAAYVHYARNPWSLKRYGLVALTFALGLLSKAMLVTLPIVLLLLDFWPLRRTEPPQKLILEKLPLLALSVLSCVLTFMAQQTALQSIHAISLPLRLSNALVSCVVYLGQMVWPVDLAAFYPFPLSGLPLWEVALAGALLAAFSAMGVWQWQKRPWLLVGWLWYLVMLLPVIGVVQVGGQAHADRYPYLPQIGIYMAVAWLAAEIPFSAGAMAGTAATALAALALCAWNQTSFWKNSETIWTRTLACTTNNEVAEGNLGEALLLRGHAQEAIPCFQAALRINPNYTQGRFNLASALLQSGKVNEAIDYFTNALRIHPEDARAHDALGTALVRAGRTDEAIRQFQQAMLLDANYAPPHYNLGVILNRQGQADAALAEFARAVEIDPAYPQAQYNLANILFDRGKVDDAIAHYQASLQGDPGHAQTYVNLGNAFLQKGNRDDAAGYYQDALQINPGFVPAHVNLGIIFLQCGKTPDAITQFEQARQLAPEDVSVLRILAASYAQTGRMEDARRTAETALALAQKAGQHDLAAQIAADLKRLENGVAVHR